MSEQTRVPFSHDEMRDAAWAATAEALLVAQRRIAELEATNTRLCEALEVVTGTLVQARFSDISDEEYDAAIASSSAALAQDAEQENA